MRLSFEDRKNLRSYVENELKEIPFSKKAKVKLDKDLLNLLLFEVIYVNGQEIKHVVWSGDFLIKVDLSEANFDNVCWEVDYCPENIARNSHICNLYEMMGVNYINLGHTNAHIDFSKAVVSRPYSSSNRRTDLSLSHVNLAKVNLSDNYINGFIRLNHVNLDNTGINLPSLEGNGISNSSLENVDLSRVVVKPIAFERISNTNLSNTGLNIIAKKNFSEIIQKPSRLNCYNNLKQAMNRGYLDGCYLNGEKIVSSELPKSSKEIEPDLAVIMGKIDDAIVRARKNNN